MDKWIQLYKWLEEYHLLGIINTAATLLFGYLIFWLTSKENRHKDENQFVFEKRTESFIKVIQPIYGKKGTSLVLFSDIKDIEEYVCLKKDVEYPEFVKKFYECSSKIISLELSFLKKTNDYRKALGHKDEIPLSLLLEVAMLKSNAIHSNVHSKYRKYTEIIFTEMMKAGASYLKEEKTKEYFISIYKEDLEEGILTIQKLAEIISASAQYQYYKALDHLIKVLFGTEQSSEILNGLSANPSQDIEISYDRLNALVKESSDSILSAETIIKLGNNIQENLYNRLQDKLDQLHLSKVEFEENTIIN